MKIIEKVLGASYPAFKEVYKDVDTTYYFKVIPFAVEMLKKVIANRKMRAGAMIEYFCNLVSIYLYDYNISIDDKLKDYINKTKENYKKISKKIKGV